MFGYVISGLNGRGEKGVSQSVSKIIWSPIYLSADMRTSVHGVCAVSQCHCIDAFDSDDCITQPISTTYEH